MCLNNRKQKILIIQQGERALPKIEWIKKHGKEVIDVCVANIDSDIPNLVDDSSEYLPEIIEVDLVLDYLKHPDLSNDLVISYTKSGIPVVSSGNKTRLGKNHYTPSVCCSLAKHVELGEYGKYFGNPELVLSIIGDKIAKVDVLRGSPCGSTWKAANKLIGVPVEEAAIQFGLNVQFFCTANPSGWDPITAKNPIHVAAEVHRSAMIKAMKT